MRIYELTGYKKHPLYDLLKYSTSIMEFIENLKREGYREYLAGEGLFAGVFSKPDDNWVVKLYYADDSGYETYLKYVLQNQNNVHVPKIIGKPVTFLKKYRILRMEKLRKYDINNEDDQKIYSALINYIDFKKIYPEHIPSNVQWLTDEYPQLSDLIDLMVKNHSSLDLHPGNIMFRGNVPVITDPFT